MFRLDNKIALLTGIGSNSSGWANGQAIAALLARQGAIIYGIDRDKQAVDRTAELIRSEDGRITTQVCDVTNTSDVHRCVEKCVEKHGRIDLLVNNVGRSEPGGPADLAPEAWNEQFSTNVHGAYNFCHYVLPIMERMGAGAVVNVSSVAGLRHIGKNQVGYASAKAALMHMTRTTAVIYAPHGIRLNCVVPGLIDTPLVRRLADKYADGQYERFVEQRNAQVPMQHMGSAWDVAYATLYLISDEAHYVTGHCLVVDGGLTCKTP